MNLTKDFAPIIKKVEFDPIATGFLQKYYPEGLISPQAIPIEVIAKEKMGLTVEHLSITDDFSELGKIFFTNGLTEIYLRDSDEYVRRMVTKGTIFIDQDVQEKRNAGCEHFTLAHECVHWEKHKLFHLVQAVREHDVAVAHRCPREPFTERTARTEEDWMEWQADGIAAAILMPKDTFRQKADEVLAHWDAMTVCSFSEDTALNYLTAQMAIHFEVSMLAAKIRLSELGYSA